MNAFFRRLQARRLASVFTILATLSAGILIGSVAARGVHGNEAQSNSSDATPLKIPNPVQLSNTFTQIAKEVGPAVVNINTEQLPKPEDPHARRRNPHNRVQPAPSVPGPDDQQDQPGDQDQQGPGGGQGNFQDFFNKFFGGQAPDEGGGGDESGIRESLGSGFIVDSKGYIITNNHVVEKADKIYVKLSTDPDSTDLGRPARLIGVDKETDLAVIKIDTTEPLPTVKLGNSDAAQVGDWVIAIGSPFNLSQTVTAGIVSAKNRTIEPGATGQFQHFIQTDAAINPGNSGGPLVDMAGEVIGVNTAIYTESQGYQGIGFAMPANTVITVYNDLIAPEHKVVRGSIGISFRQNLPGAVGRVYGFKNGVLVNAVKAGGPADKGGLKAGDIIISIDGRSIKDGDDLVTDIADRKPGSNARLGYVRDGKEATTNVTILDRVKVFTDSPTADADDSNSPEAPDAGQGKLGISVKELSSDVASKTGLHGVQITAVRPGSFADESGLRAGQVIVEINRHSVANLDQFRAVVNSLKSGQDVVFQCADPANPKQGFDYLGGNLP